MGNGQNLTSPVMHAICIELINDHFDSKFNHYLDIGCGLGYSSFLIAEYLKQNNSAAKATGIDIYQNFIDKANRIKKDFDKSDVNFECVNLLEEKFSKKFDFIHSGVAFTLDQT